MPITYVAILLLSAFDTYRSLPRTWLFYDLFLLARTDANNVRGYSSSFRF